MHIYRLNREDILTFQLFEASTNPKKKNKKMISVWLLAAFFATIAGSGYFNKSNFLLIYFSVCAILTLFLGPFYMRWKYKRQYTNYVNDTFNINDEEVKINIAEQYIEESVHDSKSKFKISEIIEVNEINTHYFIKTSQEHSLVIPKNSEGLNSDIAKLIQQHKLVHNVMINWKWN